MAHGVYGIKDFALNTGA